MSALNAYREIREDRGPASSGTPAEDLQQRLHAHPGCTDISRVGARRKGFSPAVPQEAASGEDLPAQYAASNGRPHDHIPAPLRTYPVGPGTAARVKLILAGGQGDEDHSRPGSGGDVHVGAAGARSHRNQVYDAGFEDREIISLEDLPGLCSSMRCWAWRTSRFYEHGGIDLRAMIRALSGGRVFTGAGQWRGVHHHPAAREEPVSDAREDREPQAQGGVALARSWSWPSYQG
ncbi:MAG: hypothetical protein MZU91_02850 [Desulfosudis oleivorans]|nr:hypothetical protein [Desulfosudis oleivorans]